MIFDKRFVIATALVLGFGMAACGGDDESTSCTEGQVSCGGSCIEACGEGTKLNTETCECDAAGEGEGEGEAKECGENEKPSDDGKSCWCNEGFYRPNKNEALPCMAEPKPEDCGNGQIDEGELCDVGADKLNTGVDDVLAEGVVCTDYASGNWKAEGKPGCSKDCKNYAKGTCEDADAAEPTPSESVNGVVSCKAEMTYDEAGKKVSGTATVVTTDDAAVSGIIVCGAADKHMGALVGSLKDSLVAGTKGDGNYTITSEFDGSSLTGENFCVFYAILDSKKDGNLGGDGVVCTISEEGTLVNSNNKVDKFDSALKIAGEEAVVEPAIANWTSFANDLNKDALVAGIAAGEGSTDTTAQLKWVGNDKDGSITISGNNNRLQFSSNDKGGTGATAAENSYLEISYAALAADATLTLNIETRGSVYVFTDASDQKLTSTPAEIKSDANNPADFTVTLPASSTSVRLYNETPAAKAVYINSIVIK